MHPVDTNCSQNCFARQPTAVLCRLLDSITTAKPARFSRAGISATCSCEDGSDHQALVGSSQRLGVHRYAERVINEQVDVTGREAPIDPPEV